MNPDLEKLIRLQAVETDLRRTDADLGGIPALKAELDARLAAERGTLDGIKAGLEGSQKARRQKEGELADLVHQTAMYYQDRLNGRGFSRVLVGGRGDVPGDEDVIKRILQERLGGRVESVDPTKFASLSDRIIAPPDEIDMLAPAVGILLRTQREALTA